MLKTGLTYSLCLTILLWFCACKSDSKDVNAAVEQSNKKESVDFKKPTPTSKVDEAMLEKKENVMASKQEESAVGLSEKKPPKEEPKKPKKAAEPKPRKSTVTPAPQKKAVYAKPAIEFETMTHDFGKLEEGETYDYAFKFKNTGNAPLEITSASGSCGCAQPSFPFLEIPPGGTNQIGVHYNSVNKEGDQNPEIFVTTNINDTKIKLTLTGTVNVSEERRKEKEEAIKKQKEAIAKAAEERRKKREAQEKITKARVDSILQAQKDTTGTIDPKR